MDSEQLEVIQLLDKDIDILKKGNDMIRTLIYTIIALLYKFVELNNNSQSN